MISFGIYYRVQMYVPSMKEPSGLLRIDGKWPDGATLIPWSAGRYMAWDTTVVHTCAASYLSQTAISAGCYSQDCQICIVACNLCVCPHCLQNSWACKC